MKVWYPLRVNAQYTSGLLIERYSDSGLRINLNMFVDAEEMWTLDRESCCILMMNNERA